MNKRFGDSDAPGLHDAFRLAERAVRVMETAGPTPRAESSTPKLTVETIDNHVFFYADVDSDRCLAMIRTVRETDARLRNERQSRNIPADVGLTPIWLHVQSGGGDLFAGLAAADQLAAVATPVYSVVEGVCASAATLISLACRRRYIMPSGFMLVHQFSTAKWGTHEAFKDEMALQAMLIERMVNFYAGRSKLSKAKVREMLKRDSWFDADQCVQLGLADAIWRADL